MLKDIKLKIFISLVLASFAGHSFASDLPGVRGLDMDPVTVNGEKIENNKPVSTTKAVNKPKIKAKSFVDDNNVTLKGEVSTLTTVVSKSHFIKFDEPVKRISIADPNMADLVLISPKEMLINGKKAGTTSLVIWGESEKPVFFDLAVKNDIGALNDSIRDLFPNEKPELTLTDSAKLILSGQVSSSIVKEKIKSLATAYGYEFVDLSECPTPQVVIEVKVAEASRSVVKQFGTEATATKDTKFTLADTFTSRGTNHTGIGYNNTGITFWSFGKELYGAVSAYEQNGLIKILAEPKLVATSGSQSSFNAGQSVPVPTGLDDDGQIAYEYKDIGVNVSITPTIQEESQRITLKVAPEVSEIDSTVTITQEDGTVIYGFRKRKADTTVDLKDGQTLVIAGLLQRTNTTTHNEVPYLINIPIIGKLFKSSDYRKGETELIIFVTPKIINVNNSNI